MEARCSVGGGAASFVVILCCVLLSSPGLCEEGMWLPQEVPEEILQDMSLEGLHLGQEEIYNPSGTGIANAVVRVGATGSFVSPEGLILTNHHVAFGAVQRISTPGTNYIEQGFLAKTKQEEVPAIGYVAYIMQAGRDVTKEILSVTDPSMAPSARYTAIERKKKELVSEAEAGGDIYCDVETFFGGSRYILYSFLRLSDIRVVYVPSRSIGEYGGDIDNWMWPRHTGDFSFLRAYVAPDGTPAEFSEDNVPYRPSRYLTISPQGLKEGDFALIIGFPRKTNRYLTSYALSDFENFRYPQLIRLYRQMLAILEHQADRDPTAAVRVASQIKAINNRLKNNEGMLDGFARFELVRRQHEREGQLGAALEADPEVHAKYNKLLADFESLYEQRSRYAIKDLILEFATDWDLLLGQAMLLLKWSREKARPDLDRDPEFMDRKIPDLKRKLKVFQSGFHPESDRQLLRMFIREFLNLPQGQRSKVFGEAFAGMRGAPPEEALDRFLDNLYQGTSLDQLDARLRMFGLSRQDLLKEGDPLIALAAQLDEENEARIERGKSLLGSLGTLMPQWVEVVAIATGQHAYPDANGTMRLNYGVVKGYHPRDAVYYQPFTTLSGVAAKHRGSPPFDCPERILNLAAHKVYGSYADSSLGEVPVNLLTTHDSTGGNSGSPLVNGRGELVGCLFDGNYEAMTSDFAFRDDVTRSISVDIRYVLFIAEYVDSADNVLRELGVR